MPLLISSLAYHFDVYPLLSRFVTRSCYGHFAIATALAHASGTPFAACIDNSSRVDDPNSARRVHGRCDPLGGQPMGIPLHRNRLLALLPEADRQALEAQATIVALR